MGNKSSIPSANASSTQSGVNSIRPLYQACRDGNEEQVRKLLPKYSLVELNQPELSDSENTCLHIAAANGHDSIVKLLLEHGCYRSLYLNAENQSAYELAKSTKESTRLLFIRQDENDLYSSNSSCTRFYEEDPATCFDIVKVDENDKLDNAEKSVKSERRSTIKSYKTEEEKKHEIEYSASSKRMCQSRFSRFCINQFHSDHPLESDTITERIRNLFEQSCRGNSHDYIIANDLIKQYTNNSHGIEQLLHLYTLETEFYKILKQDCLPLAIPLFMNLSKIKKRFFQGRVYRGMHMTSEQLLIYKIAMETSGTVLQTNSFSSTSIDRHVAEQFAYAKGKKHEKELCVLFVYDFPEVCDQAINLSRITSDVPCLSEYEDEKEVLILPWTLFEVTRIKKPTDDDDDLYIVYLTNIIIPKKNLISTFKWTCAELKNQLAKDKKFKFDCAFQKYKQ